MSREEHDRIVALRAVCAAYSKHRVVLNDLFASWSDPFLRIKSELRTARARRRNYQPMVRFMDRQNQKTIDLFKKMVDQWQGAYNVTLATDPNMTWNGKNAKHAVFDVQLKPNWKERVFDRFYSTPVWHGGFMILDADELRVSGHPGVRLYEATVYDYGTNTVSRKYIGQSKLKQTASFQPTAAKALSAAKRLYTMQIRKTFKGELQND